MRNNSLRQQAWQHKQQATIFKKVTQLTPNESLDEVQQVSIQPNRNKINYHQHSELKWLEKLVTQMNNFKEGQRGDQALKQKKYELKKQALEESNIQPKQMSPSQKVNTSTKKTRAKQEETKKSGRKIKFEIISNKQNKLPSQKKSLGESSCKSNDKFKNKSNKKIIHATIMAVDEKIKANQIKIKPASSHKLLEMEKLVTESFPIEQSNTKYDQSLWRNNSKETENEQKNIVFSQQKNKKSVGKIVKNSNSSTKNQNKAIKSSFQNQNKPISISKQINNNNRQQTSKKQPQKVYIKLQTQKLSKYLQQSQIQQNTNIYREQKSINLDSEQFKKYCPTKRGDHILIKATNSISNTDSEIKGIDKTTIIQRKKNVERNMKTVDPLIFKQKETNQNSSYSSYKKQKGKLTQSFFIQLPHKQKIKSQQRKLNQISRNVTQNESVSQQTKYQEPQLIPSFSFKNIQSPIKASQEQLYCQKPTKIELQQNNADRNNKQKDKKQSSQKIFTLNSEGEQDAKKQQTKKQEQTVLMINNQSQKIEKIQSTQEKDIQKEQQIQVLSIPTETQNILVQSSTKNKQKNIPFLRQSNANRSNLEIDNVNYTQTLKQLFNYLDEGKRGLLTNSNCKADKLTQELKLLLCPIVNQIRSKKKTYDLQKFLSEGQQVLKIKQQVFKASKNQTKKTNVSEILKQNVQILLKRAPLEFLQQTHTYSYYENDQNSKRESLQDKHSIVLSKLMMNDKAKNAILVNIEKRPIIEHKRRQSQIDLEQPQLYFQKKYGIQNLQLNSQCNSKATGPQKKVGVYKNLKETYVKLDI